MQTDWRVIYCVYLKVMQFILSDFFPDSSYVPYMQLDLAMKDDAGGDLSSYIQNGEWDLIGKTVIHAFRGYKSEIL